MQVEVDISVPVLRNVKLKGRIDKDGVFIVESREESEDASFSDYADVVESIQTALDSSGSLCATPANPDDDDEGVLVTHVNLDGALLCSEFADEEG